MSESLLQLPKEPFYAGSPSRKERKSNNNVNNNNNNVNEKNNNNNNKPPLSPTKNVNINIDNKNGKVIPIQPNSLDFKDLSPSSLIDNNLLMFRKVRQSKGTPRGLWTSSPTNSNMSDLMAFSFKKEPKEEHTKVSTPTYLTVPIASYWGERKDDLWLKYVKDLKAYSYDLHAHNRKVEQIASNRKNIDWSNSINIDDNQYLESKSSMVEYLMSKML